MVFLCLGPNSLAFSFIAVMIRRRWACETIEHIKIFPILSNHFVDGWLVDGVIILFILSVNYHGFIVFIFTTKNHLQAIFFYTTKLWIQLNYKLDIDTRTIYLSGCTSVYCVACAAPGHVHTIFIGTLLVQC